MAGCSASLFHRSDTNDLLLEEVPTSSPLIAGVAHPHGLNLVKVEAVGLVMGLDGTGFDPPPSPQRAALMAEMNRREVSSPNEVLASPNTALVLVRGILRPGIQKGDRFDVEVTTSSRSEATSLRGGKLLETRLTELAVLGEQIRKGHLMALAQGPVLVDPSADEHDDAAHATRGRILSGGVSTKSRKLGLWIDHENQSVRLSQQIGKAINERFHTYIDGNKSGVATPKTDKFIELEVHPRYKDNVGRYMRVIRSIAINETRSARQARLLMLSEQLVDPLTTATAALRLEAIGGDEAIEVLRQGIVSDDPEVRFYAAEALAYLDETDAVASLAEAAHDDPAFRVNALAALSAMDDAAAYDALRGLLDVRSAETRYGAFRALWAMSPGDPLVRGEDLKGQFSYHVLDTNGPPLIHATSSHRAELVLFGHHHTLKTPFVLDAGKNILINGLHNGTITVSRFQSGEADQQRTVPGDVDQLIRTVTELGATYPDVVQMLQQANDCGALGSRFRVNALPEQGRSHVRTDDSHSDEAAIETPEPELFNTDS